MLLVVFLAIYFLRNGVYPQPVHQAMHTFGCVSGYYSAKMWCAISFTALQRYGSGNGRSCVSQLLFFLQVQLKSQDEDQCSLDGCLEVAVS
jgi:hypothetical protein